MSGITNPAEEYFKDGLWGWVTTAWKKLVATAGGALHIQFAGQEADVEITQTAAADLTPGVCGWTGSAWQKLPLLFGYSDRWAEAVAGVAVDAGNAVDDTEPVSLGYVYVLQAFSIEHDAGANKHLWVRARTNGIAMFLFQNKTATSGQNYTWVGEVVLKKDDFVRFVAEAPGNGKHVYGAVWGYKMLIAE